MKDGTSKLYKHPKASTLYLTIPSDVVKDSTFPFKQGDIVNIWISTDHANQALVISLESRKDRKQ
ncbi:hypothetical protein MUP77_21780 [Candidatus Bathyarchaeota archaeon]|nr:hypothetical protein [Candidatus Bathyarchaeota archaeon]